MTAPQYMPTRAQPPPAMLKSGLATRLTESESNSQSARIRVISVSRLELVIMAPLGSPVVPEV